MYIILKQRMFIATMCVVKDTADATHGENNGTTRIFTCAVRCSLLRDNICKIALIFKDIVADRNHRVCGFRPYLSY